MDKNTTEDSPRKASQRDGKLTPNQIGTRAKALKPENGLFTLYS